MFKVFIVDDAVLVRKELVLTTDWEGLNCSVVGEAGNAQTAMELILELKPDIVITDIKMGHMSGLDLIRELKARNVEAEFIVISGYSEFEYAFSAIKLEVQNYILKPISDEEIVQTIKKTIAQIETKKRATILKENIDIKDPEEKIRAVLYEAESKSHMNVYLRKALEHIRLYYMEDLGVKEVAGNLFISESYLTKLFKQELNITFIEYLTQVRIRKAIDLMQDISLPIYLISERVGYKDYRYFSAIFKKMIGLTPNEYRKSIGLNN